MYRLARDAIEIYRRDGTRALICRTIGRARRTYLSEIRLRLVPPLDPVHVRYSVGDQTARFAVTTRAELRRLLSPEGVPESPIHEDLLDRLEPDDVFYDIGANVGIYACLAGSVAEAGGGRVVAFEPLPSNVKKLRQNAALNGVSMDIHEVALSDKNDTGAFEPSGDGTAGEGQGRLTPDAGSSGESTTIETRRGDDMIAAGEIDPPTAVKIDVEGAEMKVVRGLSSALASSCRLVYCEVHDNARRGPDDSDIRDFGDQPEEVRETLESAGYRVDRILERNTPIRKGYVLRGTREP
jgi:FkbM family methyltransferase